MLFVTENKKKYGFEADKKKLAAVLTTRLSEFIHVEDFNEFCYRLHQISKIELILKGINNPQEKTIESIQQQYFAELIPKIYDAVLIDFQKRPKSYKRYPDAGNLEITPEHSFYKLNEIANAFEKEIIQKYKKKP